MLLNALLVVDAWLNGYGVAQEESVTHLYARHEVVVAFRVNILGIGTEEDAVLRDVITTAHAKAEGVALLFSRVVEAGLGVSQ